ncbi:3-hydroxybutyryl-CoA dehydrogenase [Metabacillus niabensis]|uniref:3-hydroxybutyryl-CoA dehydrogenase n=1 Tax=Metabacillus niabensis TaxID=324854 RepID=UPI0039A3CF43
MNNLKIMVVGAGQMGRGIAHVCAMAGFPVILYDLEQVVVSTGKKLIEDQLGKQVEKGKLAKQEMMETCKRITTTTELVQVQTVDFVIEAVVEKITVKKDVFHQLDKLAPPHTILATNTSSCSITEIAAVTNRPENVIGMHFMNPVPVMKLVEIIRGLATNDNVFERTKSLAEALNKTPVEVNDYPGFASNRILMPMINEAIYTVYEGVATKDAVDEVMKLGMNHPMGPLRLADFIGLDTCLYIMETLHNGLGDDKYRPCPLLKNYVKAGWLGKKTGRGFYQYE